MRPTPATLSQVVARAARPGPPLHAQTQTPPQAHAQPHTHAAPRAPALERLIGVFLRQLRRLDDAQIERIVRYQNDHEVRFGEAAVALDLASTDDVLWALSQQFQYPYAAHGAATGLNDELIAAIDPFCDQAETLRDVRSQLLGGVLAPENGPRALAVLSPSPGDGKTYLAANLAVVFSQLGRSTLLVEADLRAPRASELFGIAEGPGLSGMLSGRGGSDTIHRIAALPSLHLLPVGTLPPNPLELLQRPAFGLLIEHLCRRFDHVIVDTAAASHGADARVTAARCGAALVLGRRGRTRMDALQTLVHQVTQGRALLAGVLMNEH